ncbi:MAG: diadenylate cyclase CdaA [Clostridia bacterium]|nr:diadenylate cyclase CdaA [Clostridia bacterium]
MGVLSGFLEKLIQRIRIIEFKDIVDILVVAIIFFCAIKFLHERRATKIVGGIALVLVLMLVGNIFEMSLLNYLLSNISQVGIIAIIIVFQPELRTALEKMGKRAGKFGSRLKGVNESQMGEFISDIAKTVCELSATKTGALMVVERGTNLENMVKDGTVIDAKVSPRLLGNIFNNKAPLHDGAVIIRDLRVHMAGCVLPLSDENEALKNLGTRHRAGVGMSEKSDAVVVIVSEETGIISVAVDGILKRGFTEKSFIEHLNGIFLPSEKPEKNVKLIKKK